MALKQFVKSGSWAAVTPSLGLSFSGTNQISKDSLEVSIGHPYPFSGTGPFQAVHTELSGSIGLPQPGASPTTKRFIEPFGPSSFGGRSFGSIAANIPTDAEIVARTNPSRASVNLPVFLFELREIPELIRHLGRVLSNPRKWGPTDPGKTALAIQFGWNPLLSDLKKISGLQSSIERRRKEIDGLFSRKGLKTTIGLGGGSTTNQFSQNANFGSYRNFSVSVSETLSWNAWAYVRWKPNSKSSLPPSDNQLALKILGLTPGHIAESVWEALPWSWLIDYFTNIGAVIKAGNHSDYRPFEGAVMTQFRHRASHPSTTQQNDMLSAGICTRRENNRKKIGASTVVASLPILSARQVSVLTSLAVVRGLK